jgi:hypothetical protein
VTQFLNYIACKKYDRSSKCYYVLSGENEIKSQGNHFKFIEDIPGDPLAYVEGISQELVHLDNVFLQAAATIFNKDIVLITPTQQA